MHPRYKKYFDRNFKFLVHDEKDRAKIGDLISFFAVRPISRGKRFCLYRVLL